MKYVVTGGAGRISKTLAEKLLAAGHDVTVISRDAARLKHLTSQGAHAAIGSFEDAEFLQKTFTGADAVYTMISPPFSTQDIKAYSENIGKNYTRAIDSAGVKYVVNLSSVGAHLADGCGPVSGLYLVEQCLNGLKNVHIRHLRPNYFFANFLDLAGMIRNMNILGDNFGGPGFKLVLSDTDDIAGVAFEELSQLTFTGHTVKYLASDERFTDDIARLLGTAVGKPELRWVTFTDEQAYEGMKQMGLPEEFARSYTEMGRAFREGIMLEDYWKNKPPSLGKTKLENFVKIFSAHYQTNH